MKKAFLLFAVFILIICESSSGLIINEALSNEPGNSTALEWIELYNEQATPVLLAGYEIAYSSGTIILPGTVELAPGEYYIICRRLFAIGDSPGFETVWGDASGVWGDSPYESELQIPFVATFSLINDTVTIVLFENSTPVSGLFWNEPGLDGYSWERQNIGADIFLQSLIAGGTPGIVNSVTPVNFDLSLDSVKVNFDNSTTRLSFYITNRGLTNVSGAIFNLYENDVSIDILEIGDIATGESKTIVNDYTFSGLYLNLYAELADDNRPSNNRLDFTAVGEDYPPLILSELMANPFFDLETEWLECKNIYSVPLDLSTWLFGDALGLYSITDTPITVFPGDYFVLVENSQNFMNFFFNFDGVLIEPPQWSTFNNGSDIVRLVDRFNIEADRFAYDSTLAENRTWSRSEQPGYENRWGKSADEHGTPGEPNVVFFDPEGTSLDITVEPTHFSPDGDGIDDETIITLNIPEAVNYTIKIYDRYGRAVRMFYDEDSGLEDEFSITWDGKDDNGNRLPIGLYILYVEADSVTSDKIPMVIAR